MEGKHYSLPLVNGTHVAQYPERMMHRVILRSCSHNYSTSKQPIATMFMITCMPTVNYLLGLLCLCAVYLCVLICVYLCVYIPVMWIKSTFLFSTQKSANIELTPQAQTLLSLIQAWPQNGAILLLECRLLRLHFFVFSRMSCCFLLKISRRFLNRFSTRTPENKTLAVRMYCAYCIADKFSTLFQHNCERSLFSLPRSFRLQHPRNLNIGQQNESHAI